MNLRPGSLPSDPQRSIGFLLTDVAHLLRRNFNRRLLSLGLTQAQWRAIAFLARDEGVNQACLAESLEVQPITLARLIDRMQAAGWVERRTDPGDRRAVRLYLTEQCQPILAEMHERATQMLEEVLSGVSASARKQLIETLSQIKQNLAEAAEAAAGQGPNGKATKNVRRQLYTEDAGAGRRTLTEKRGGR